MNRIIVLLSLFISFGVKSEVFIRYNHLGYSPSSEKRAIVMSGEDLKGISWELKNDNKIIQTGSFDKSIAGVTKHTSHPFNYEIDFSTLKGLGTYQISVGSKSVQVKVVENPYSGVAVEVLRFLKVQRCGSEATLDHTPGHLGDTLCLVKKRTGGNSGWEAPKKRGIKMDVSGGWYDAGDYLKFTLTNAYTTFLILKAYQENPKFFDYKKYTSSDLNDLLDEAKWGLDYLMRVSENPDEFVIQVGDIEDHDQGDRLPSDDALNGKRHAYSDFSGTQIGFTVAALSIGAEVFKDSEFAEGYKNRAIQLYEKKTSKISWVEQGWEKFYADDTYADNLQLAAGSLYKLTKNDAYLKDALKFAHQSKAGYWCSWGNANMYAHNLIVKKENQVSTYLVDDLENFKGITEELGNIWGVDHEYTWASLYSMLAVANNAFLYDENKNVKTYDNMIRYTLDYTFGLNNWGIGMVALKQDEHSIQNVYSQIYKLQPDLYPSGAVAEGPGDRESHEDLKKYFEIPESNNFEGFNSKGVVFYDLDTDFQTMETTITGLAEMILLMALVNK